MTTATLDRTDREARTSITRQLAAHANNGNLDDLAEVHSLQRAEWIPAGEASVSVDWLSDLAAREHLHGPIRIVTKHGQVLAKLY